MSSDIALFICRAARDLHRAQQRVQLTETMNDGHVTRYPGV